MKLKKSLGFFSLTNIVVANMIGAGIFTTSGLIMTDLANPNILIILWIIGGITALCGALSYSELGITYPKAGGEYIFLSKLYHPLAGFLSGWVSFVVGFSAPVAASAIGLSEYVTRAVVIDREYLYLFKKTFAVAVIIIFTLVHVRGLKTGAGLQNILTILKIVLIVVLIIIGFGWGQGNFEHFSVAGLPGLDFARFETFGLSLLWIMFAYSGWNASTYVGSEIKQVSKNIPRSLFTGTLVVTLLYVLLNILFVYAIPPEKMKGVISIGGLAVNELFGKSLDRGYSLFIAVALLSSLSAFIIIGPRVYYAMAENGHFFKGATYINTYAVPSKSIFFQSALSVLFVLSGTFDQILTFLGFSLGVFPVLAVIGVFKLRMSGKSRIKMPGYPFVQIFYLLISLSILILAYFERPVESSIALGVIILGIPVYFLIHPKK